MALSKASGLVAFRPEARKTIKQKWANTLMQMIKYYTRGFISKSLLLYVIWKNKKLVLQIY